MTSGQHVPLCYEAYPADPGIQAMLEGRLICGTVGAKAVSAMHAASAGCFEPWTARD